MHPIPTPELLDPDRLLANDRGGFFTADDDEPCAELLDNALHQTCTYARQLWENLDAVRQYLYESLPPDPRSPGPHPRAGAAPAGPDDQQGWENWIAAYASVTSVLCGPHGDSGFGLREARRAAQERRTAPNLNHFAHHYAGGHSGAGTTTPATESASAAADEPAPRQPIDAASATQSAGQSALRSAITAALVVLALRGLRVRRRIS